jgi:hypothetical protein
LYLSVRTYFRNDIRGCDLERGFALDDSDDDGATIRTFFRPASSPGKPAEPAGNALSEKM